MDDLEYAYNIAAEIVRKFGDTYLPLFKRMHTEMQKRSAEHELKKIALSVASKANTN